MNRRDEATERQVQAASPELSVWLSANAGSGKTRVLIDRVARLLLENVLPQNILCLTYTKAAASEMQNRLFKRLGIWTMLDSDSLATELQELGVDRKIDKETLRKARRLFARAIEAPGGLKVQTIHSFCASLLRRFPLEAGVSPQFTEMDDRAAKLLRAEIVEEMAAGDNVDAIDALAAHYTDSDFDRLTAEVAKHRDRLGGPADKVPVWKMFDLSPETDKSSIIERVIVGGEGALLQSLIAVLNAGSKMDIQAAKKLERLNVNDMQFQDLAVLESVLLFQSGKTPFAAKIGKFPTAATQKLFATHMDSLNDLMLRVEAARDTRLSILAAQKTHALHQFAEKFLPLYEGRKQQKGWLDFDDLISLTDRLLSNQTVAQWVLYRLDGGTDHILVDEAQDTSPQQWKVIQNLTQEMTAGEGAHSDKARTIFVVGDKKQSIYSFQGADPEGFERMEDHFETEMRHVTPPFMPLELEYSFRSAEPILRLVDHTFDDRFAQGLGGTVKHRAFKSDMPGRIDLWPIIPKTESPPDKDWFDPTDRIAKNHESIVLANEVAESIASMCHNKALIPEEIGNSDTYRMCPVREGDFLILVQRRSALFHEIIRACKEKGLEIAGADRLKIGAELAVKDLTALLSFLATPEDDLSLAAALRSPLFGWSEQALFDLAHKRPDKTFLWSEMRNRKDEFPQTMQILDALRKDADYLRPFELLERVLTKFGGRKKLLARLGKEAEDGIDALISQALSYERMDVPSLTGFITWLQAEEVEIKRQMDSAGNRIRVMTVHGSKGLEAPIVILPDTAKRDLRLRDEIYPTENDGLIWQVRKDDSPKVVTAARKKLTELQEQERMRLLYVAMTRAEKWLIVCGAGELGKDGKSWHAIVENGMKSAGAVSCGFETGDGLRLQSGNWESEAEEAETATVQGLPELPDWANALAAVPERPEKTLSPSDLGGAKALPGDGLGEAEAKRRGSYIHLLLEHLPKYQQADWKGLAEALLPDAAPDELSNILAEVSAVLCNAKLNHLFSDDALVEVPVTASLEELGDARIHGEIDRLLIFPTHVLVVDFKSNAVVPQTEADVPDGVLRQLGAYCAALEKVYPAREIRASILWTRNATLMSLDPSAMTAALRATALP